MIALSENGNLLDALDFLNILIFHRFVDKESFGRYMSSALKIPQNTLKYLYWCAGHWSGSNKQQGWSFNESNFVEYVTVEDAYRQICSLRKTKAFSLLEYELKEIAIAFHLWYNSDRIEHSDLSKDRVDELIPEWEE